MATATTAVSPDILRQRELYYFALFRCLEAALLVLWALGPIAKPELLGTYGQTLLPVLAIGYLALATVFMLVDRIKPEAAYLPWAFAADLAVFAGLAYLLPGSFYSFGLLMLVNLAAGGLLLDKRYSHALTLGAIGVLVARYLLLYLSGSAHADFVQTLMFAATYAATVSFCQMLANQAKNSQALADSRGQQLADMAQMSEIIISRMRTGVILLDKHHSIQLSNDAARQLSQKPLEKDKPLRGNLPELEKQLWLWRRNPESRPEPLVLYEGGPEVIPRFVALSLHDMMYLAFLEDSRVFSGRADELQLATLGRLSASIAHEIRNPLAAISYAQQLLSETTELPEADKRLLEIIGTQTQRMNGIIENVMRLAKREAATPQSIELNAFVKQFLDEHLATHPQDGAHISLKPASGPAIGLFDPSHLNQVLGILLSNALTYGHEPHQPPKIQLGIRIKDKSPILEMTDSGPGIPPGRNHQLFNPFFTTSESGTGLGLYIAKQLCDANQAMISHENAFGGGSRFSVRLSSGQNLLMQPE